MVNRLVITFQMELRRISFVFVARFHQNVIEKVIHNDMEKGKISRMGRRDVPFLHLYDSSLKNY